MEDALHGRPTSVELVVAAREFLADELLPTLEGRLHFLTRVTLRVLDTIARQLELGPAQALEHETLLRSFGYDSDVALVAAIRAGAFDDRIDEVARAMVPDVRSKLAVSNPPYLYID